MPLAVAKRYAQALGEVVTKPSSGLDPEALLAQLQGFAELIDNNAELKNILLTPAVSTSKKRALIEDLAKRLQYPEPLRNFLYVVVDHRRLKVLDEMCQAFREWLDDRLGIARIEVTSALPIVEEQRAGLVKTFSEVTGREVRALFREDASILGGVIVQHGSRIYDGSLRAQLRALDQAIAQHA